MADEEAIFDPSLKKKKKTKTGFDLDAALAESSPVETSAPTPDKDDDLDSKDDLNMDELLGKKKSKKKKKPFNLDELGDALPEASTLADAGEDIAVTGEPGAMDDLDLNMDFTRTKKKKMKKKKMDLDELIGIEEHLQDGEDKENESGDVWLESDRDYTYDELLQRAFNQLREKNPEMATGEKKKFIMKPPQVVRIGSKKSAFANFSEICRLLHRLPKHLLQFLLAELGTSGSIDGNNQLIIKGRFQQKQIENVLRRYIKEYVTCHTCRSPDTILQKDARLYFLQCEQCNSRCSVAPIKSGFQAVANKQQRQAIRASKN